MKLDNMVLYYKPTCPYCQRVTHFIEANGIEMDMRDTLVEAHLEELLAINGVSQVPCLVVDGKPMLESEDIILYLKSVIE